MLAKCCVRCGGLFHPRPQNPDQSFCSSLSCQRARKRLWQQSKLCNDDDYRENQRAAQRNWQARNPDYWRQYRSRQAEKSANVPAAKMDASSGLLPGLYRIRRSAKSTRKTRDLWTIELVSSYQVFPRKMDASREDLIDSRLDQS